MTLHRTRELLESWLNGNRSWVIDQLLAEPDPADVALATARLLQCLISHDDQDTFMRLLAKRVKS
jgi:hypothetical protein